MPEITLFGWFHTIMGIVAILSGVYSLAKFKVIRSDNTSGQVFLVCTLIAAASALGIYHQTGGFNIAHGLAVLTLLALGVGFALEKTNLLGGFSPYLQATSYTACFLFHMIPAITDGLRRLPPEDPVVKTVDDPLLLGFYLTFLIMYVVGLGLQLLWLRRQNQAA